MSDIDRDHLRRLDGGLLLVFRELLRTRRATQAADRLGLSQSAISHALNRLRDLFDDQLFVRRPHGFEPTARALELGPQVELLIELAGQAISPNSGFDSATSTRMFSFGAPEFVTGLVGADLINRLKAQAPGASFAVSHTAEDDAYRALRQGQMDFALGRFGAARPGYVTEPIFEDVYCVVAREGHPTIRGDIDEQRWRETGHIYAWSQSETAPSEVGGSDDVTMLAAVPHWLTVLMLVSSTDGVATCPRRFAQRHAAKLGLQVLDPPFEPDVISVSAVRRAGLKDEGVAWFLDQVRQAALA